MGFSVIFQSMYTRCNDQIRVIGISITSDTYVFMSGTFKIHFIGNIQLDVIDHNYRTVVSLRSCSSKCNSEPNISAFTYM
jgi:hypothetical protein